MAGVHTPAKPVCGRHVVGAVVLQTCLELSHQRGDQRCLLYLRAISFSLVARPPTARCCCATKETIHAVALHLHAISIVVGAQAGHARHQLEREHDVVHVTAGALPEVVVGLPPGRVGQRVAIGIATECSRATRLKDAPSGLRRERPAQPVGPGACVSTLESFSVSPR